MNNVKDDYYDLIIVGGGLVGAGLAVALRESGLTIALVDARLPTLDDPRLFALNEGSCQFLKNLRLWPKLAPHAAPIHQVHVSHQGRFGAVRLCKEEVHLPQLGYVIPARFIETALFEAIQQAPITLFQPAKLKSLQQANQQARLTLETEDGEKVLSTGIVIGADGTDSTVRAQLSMEMETVDYQQSAMVTRTLLQRSHRHIAYERFNSTGAIAMLPLKEQECATIWTADQATIARLSAYSDDLFLQALQTSFGYRLGRLKAVTKRHQFPLRMVRAKRAVHECVFLLGNSAHTLPPIAAQGFNLAVYEVASLVGSIMAKRAKGEAFNATDLQQMSELTQKQQALSIGVSHQLSQLFTQDSMFLSAALQLGMIGLDIALPIKKRFIEAMIGRMGRVPRLLLNINEGISHA